MDTCKSINQSPISNIVGKVSGNTNRKFLCCNTNLAVNMFLLLKQNNGKRLDTMLFCFMGNVMYKVSVMAL